MQNSRPAWKDVPEVMSGGNGSVRLTAETADRGTMSGAHLVTDYFAVENRTKEPIRWCIPRKSNRLETLRRQLADSQAKWGVVMQSGLSDRPGAGKPMAGPLPYPEPRAKRPVPLRILPLRADFRIPSDQVFVPGLTWQFRSMLHRRLPDMQPIFHCTGLLLPDVADSMLPGKEVA